MIDDRMMKMILNAFLGEFGDSLLSLRSPHEKLYILYSKQGFIKDEENGLWQKRR